KLIYIMTIALGVVTAMPTHKKFLQPEYKSSSKISPLRLSSTNTPTPQEYQESFRLVNHLYQILAKCPAGLTIAELSKLLEDASLSTSELKQVLMSHKQWFTHTEGADDCVWKASMIDG
ncbi:MAG: hypothetical protein ACRYGR_09620, partial [Janthinobacterium lividum]